MKIKQLITVLALSAMFYACGNQAGSQENNTERGENPTSQTEDVHQSEQLERYKFQCLLGDKIPIDITFEIKYGIIQGQLVYTNTENKTPIILLGNVDYKGDQPTFCMSEKNADGNTTGEIKVQILADGKLGGTWSSPCKIEEKNNDFNYIDSKKLAITTSKIIDENTNLYSDKAFFWNIIEKPSGTYRFSMGENCKSGTIKLYQQGGKTICDISTNSSAPSFNMAIVDRAECVWQNNRFEVSNSDYGDCQFAIYPFKQFVVVKYIDNKMDCGFGANAYISGTYMLAN